MLEYKQLLDYVIGILYVQKFQRKMGPVSLKTIIDLLNYPAKYTDINQIAKYLEANGYIKATYKLGYIYIESTPSGLVHFEGKDESFKKEFTEYIKGLDLDKLNQTERQISNSSRKTISELLVGLQKRIEESYKDKADDILKDVIIIREELQKQNPDKDILNIKITQLQQYDKILDDLNELKGILNLL